MRLEGSLDAFSLPDIFSLLAMTKKTGGLHLRRDNAHGVVWFTTGAITGGASDTSRQSLARRLVGTGSVGPDVLEAAIARSNDDVGVGRALQLDGGLDEGVLHDAASEHIVDTVFDLLRWPEGDFAFVVDEANPDDVGVSRQADEVVTEARRRLDVWGSVATAIPSPQVVLAVAATPNDDPQLSRDEWSLLALVDGRRTVGEIVTLCGRGEFAVVSALADLVGRGLVTTETGSGVTALARMHELLVALEGVAAVAAPQPVQVAPAGVHAADARQPAVEDADDADEDSDRADAEVTPIARPAAAVRTPAQRDGVTPQRPEPFLPARQPEHPEEPTPVAMAAAGGAAAAPAPVSSIERDPSVNKSLLLRLIAGVRGL